MGKTQSLKVLFLFPGTQDTLLETLYMNAHPKKTSLCCVDTEISAPVSACEQQYGSNSIKNARQQLEAGSTKFYHEPDDTAACSAGRAR